MTEENKALIIAPPTTPEEFVKKRVDQFLEKIRTKAAEFEWPADLSKKTNRDKARSFAYQLYTKSKTDADKSGKDLTAEMKARVKIVDEGRKIIRDTLDKEKTEFLKPVIEWEAVEEARNKRIQDDINIIKSYQFIDVSLPSEKYRSALDGLVRFDIEAGNYGDRQPEAQEEKERSEKFLKLMLENAVNREKEAERKAKEEDARKERERQEYEEHLKREAAEKARLEEQDRARLEQEGKDRQIREEQERLQREKIEAQLRAERAEQEKKEAAERAEREKREAAEKAERDKQAAIEAERRRVEEENRRKKEEEARRKADHEHKKKIKADALDDMLARGFEKSVALKLLFHIDREEIRHLFIKY